MLRRVARTFWFTREFPKSLTGLQIPYPKSFPVVTDDTQLVLDVSHGCASLERPVLAKLSRTNPAERAACLQGETGQSSDVNGGAPLPDL